MKKYLIFLTFGFLILVYIWQGIYLPKEKFSENKIFLVEKGQNLFQIAENLEKEGLIKNRYFFDFYVLIQGKAKKLQAGKYELNSAMSVAEIAKKIISGQTLKIKLTIPEGFNLKEISNLTEKNFLKLKIGDFKEEFEFLKEVPSEASLEGFLFPDTYFLRPEMTEREMAKFFLKNFDKKLSPPLRAEIERQGKTIFEIIKMASLIEKEVYNTPECPDCKNLVSGILWKRLKTKIPLQADATLIYICDSCQNLTFQEMLKEVGKMKEIDSPYNTYKYLGFPPGPICNPGLESIIASVYPKDSEYWYYLSTPEGKTIFSKSLEEHNYAKAKYLR